ncbi:valyl-tRNA synthetase [Dethiosulfatibacter aminovorans DSM 17477]|uniref:Valine--tRNA ligase n=1 Tax=Dethiosulfatibacter aminovorans DSM 17477 TaxID=1121476 RepID=A0A1M6FMZ4_9FIRM|nr:valine--tRNA ligase [Dethiosulfatibacter aminovorans]SHI99013.1 valyl-tRNA synthetase [Dethiosulfatibacter aminovorans DSM 17477]
MNNLPKNYNPKDFEERIYETWEKEGHFHAEVNKDKKPFTIVIPPPNITGQLHMGHALDHTLQDILIRWKRMQGFETLWLPGSDHASIATEVKVVEKIKNEEGMTKEEVGRDGFLERAWKWKDEFGGRITEQMRKLGDSCDWERERFTMDQGCSDAVTQVFIDLYNKGLIYRGNRIINWCPDCLTSISDAEVEHEDKPGNYYYVKYFFVDNEEEYFTIATTRPETIFGDTAIAVHPDDERYKDLIGKKVIVPLTGREIEIIGDEYPDMEKGTGALKVTPSHDPNDFEIGQRHNLEQLSCMNEDGSMNEVAGKYEGMDRYECRKLFVKELEEKGYIVKIEETDHAVGTCYRCNTVIEPRISEQWFVNMEPLAGPAIKAVKDGETKFVPERFDKIYYHWLENIRDWCISRQLWWGHRIPAYYCSDCGETMVQKDAPEKCSKCGSTNVKQDEDVLDTWFSSALWPFSTLGWPNDTEELKYFYPTDVLVTGYDIIFFWIVRMMFSGIEQMEEIPFKHVFVHGLVRDADGRKMSKSLGNGVDPLEVIDQYGADALRFMLMTGITAGNDTRFKVEKLESSRNFANKLWNASRFVLMNVESDIIDEETAMKNLKPEDKWIMSRVNYVSKDITANLDNFDLGIAVHKIYEFIWNEYCDWYIELVKPRLYGEAGVDKDTAIFVLIKVMKDMLKLLHPFMPFITEEIWGYLPGNDERLIVSSWPVYSDDNCFQDAEDQMELAMNIVRSIRNIKAEMDVIPSKKVTAHFIPGNDKISGMIEEGKGYFSNLANVEEIKIIGSKEEAGDNAASSVIDGVEIYIPLADLIDFEKEVERLEKEKSKLEGEIKRAEGKLNNKGFTDKAPEKVVAAEREKLEKYKDMFAKVIERIEQLKK